MVKNYNLADLMDQMHSEMAQKLLDAVRDEGCTPQMLELARKFLKDNGIDSVPRENSALDKLRNLPVFGSDEDVEVRH